LPFGKCQFGKTLTLGQIVHHFVFHVEIRFIQQRNGINIHARVKSLDSYAPANYNKGECFMGKCETLVISLILGSGSYSTNRAAPIIMAIKGRDKLRRGVMLLGRGHTGFGRKLR
jgi:hypothetical protein